jgi:beta-hydroxylase
VSVAPVWLALFAALGAVAASAAVVHRRGRVRHRLLRQLTDHSTFTAPYNVLMYLFSAVPNRPILELERFPELAPLVENWEVFRKEVLRLRENRLFRKEVRYNDIAFNDLFRRGWRRFHLKWYGEFLPSAERLCPESVELLRRVPSVNAALFALLPAGTHLGGHRDPFAGSLRLHLGLVTPGDERCRLHVDGIPYTWRDGEAIVFDETYIHAAENEWDQSRIILFCDIERPLRTPVMRALNRFVIRRVVKWTASQNVETDRVGWVNRLSPRIHRLRRRARGFQRVHPRSYTALRWGLPATALALLAWAAWV